MRRRRCVARLGATARTVTREERSFDGCHRDHRACARRHWADRGPGNTVQEIASDTTLLRTVADKLREMGGIPARLGNQLMMLFDKDEQNNDNQSKATVWLSGQNGDIVLRNADCAEEFDIADVAGVEPGAVMVIGAEDVLALRERRI